MAFVTLFAELMRSVEPVLPFPMFLFFQRTMFNERRRVVHRMSFYVRSDGSAGPLASRVQTLDHSRFLFFSADAFKSRRKAWHVC